MPPVELSRKIAAILSAYDELIENNKRRIALLEKLAEEIYREWFVRLRFPGHEKVKFVKGVPTTGKLKSSASRNFIELQKPSQTGIEFYDDIWRWLPFHQGVDFGIDSANDHVVQTQPDVKLEKAIFCSAIRAPVVPAEHC